MENNIENMPVEPVEIADVPESAEVSVPSDTADIPSGESDFSSVFDAVAPEYEEPTFTSDFTVGDIRKKAKAARKGSFLQTYPKALLYAVLMMVPALLIAILGSSKTADSVVIGRIIQIIGMLIPVIFGGPLFLGFMSGIMKICRGEKFKLKDLFAFFMDARFGKALGSFVVLHLICMLIMLICQIPAMLISLIAGGVSGSAGFAGILIVIFEILAFIVYLLAAARFIMTFMLIIDHPKMPVFKAIQLSLKAMKGNCVKFLLMIFSYIGWYALSLIIAMLLMVIIYAAGNTYLMTLGDFYTYYMAMLRFMLVFYIGSYLIIMIAASTMITRPAFGIIAFYDTMIGHEWDIKIEDPFAPEEWAVIKPDDSSADAELIAEPEVNTADLPEPIMPNSSDHENRLIGQKALIKTAVIVEI